MLRKMLKPYSLLLYLLLIIVSFFIGIMYAHLTEAGKDQMFAGGAIVLFNGVVGSFIGFFISLFVVYNTNRKIIIRLNIIISIAIVAFWAFFAIKYQNRLNIKQQNAPPEKRKPTTPAPDAIKYEMSFFGNAAFIEKELIASTNQDSQKGQAMGLGIFSPNFYENKVLHFYGNINHDKALSEHLPFDSITFSQSDHHNYQIGTAPPWIIPQHLKLDYGILHFKIKTIYQNFIEIEVNSKTGQTSFINPYAGKIQYWPEFLSKVHSLEFKDPETQFVKVKPMDHAGEVLTIFNIMQPIAIQQDWVMVELRNSNYKKVGKGWVKWRDNGELLLNYSLLS